MMYGRILLEMIGDVFRNSLKDMTLAFAIQIWHLYINVSSVVEF